jgi:uncharacterized Zn finger protein
MNKKWIHCNACGADAYKKLSKVGEWNIGKCTKCGLIYVNPIPFFEPTTDFSGVIVKSGVWKNQLKQRSC